MWIPNSDKNIEYVTHHEIGMGITFPFWERRFSDGRYKSTGVSFHIDTRHSMTPPDWLIDEYANAGSEHIDPDAVSGYDERTPFDPRREVALLRAAGIDAADTVVDVGSGTGVFAVAMAEYCAQVIGVDISAAMIDVARDRATEFENITFVRSGIVDYHHTGPPVAAVFSRNTFHHLPAFWKVEGLKTVASILEPGGIFRYRDIVYSFDPWDSTDAIDSWIDARTEAGMDRDVAIQHVRDEYSQYTSLMEAMLESVGFEILDRTYHDDCYGYYTCRWPGG